jgi:hypothetical protein
MFTVPDVQASYLDAFSHRPQRRPSSREASSLPNCWYHRPSPQCRRVHTIELNRNAIFRSFGWDGYGCGRWERQWRLQKTAQHWKLERLLSSVGSLVALVSILILPHPLPVARALRCRTIVSVNSSALFGLKRREMWSSKCHNSYTEAASRTYL